MEFAQDKMKIVAYMNTPRAFGDKRKPGPRWSYLKLYPYAAEFVSVLQLDPEFAAHLAARTALKGTIRDVKVALAATSCMSRVDYVRENGQAILCTFNPRMIEQGLRLAQSWRHASGATRAVRLYLEWLEKDAAKWTKVAVAFRQSLKSLYMLTHYNGTKWMADILFKHQYPVGSVFEFIADMPKMGLEQLMEGIQRLHIPHLVAAPHIARLAKAGPEGLLAYMGTLTPAQVVKKSKQLGELGVGDYATTRALFEEKLEAASKHTKSLGIAVNAIEALEDDEHHVLAAKLQGLQDRQYQTAQSEMERHDILWLGDISGSMEPAIDIVRSLSAVSAAMNKGRVHCVFFNDSARYFDFTGKTFSQICDVTKRVRADGATSIGLGLEYARVNNLSADVIGVVTDGGENTGPLFSTEYAKYCQALGKDVPVYVFPVGNYHPGWIQEIVHDEIPLRHIDTRHGHGLEDIVKQMRPNRFSVLDEIYATELFTLAEVLK